jgi:hypothetical protein
MGDPRDGARVALGVHHRGGVACPARRIIGLGTEQPAARSAGARRVPERDVRERGGADHRDGGLREGRVGLVKASITGSIVGNLLLVLGLAFFVGPRRKTQKASHRATNATAMLSSPSSRWSCRRCSI